MSASESGTVGDARLLAAAESARDRAIFGGMIGALAIAALAIAGFVCDATGERQPSFGDDEEPRFVGGRGGAFDQIEAGGRQLAVLKFQTHWRTQSTFGKDSEAYPDKDSKRHVEFGKKRQTTCAVPSGERNQLRRA